MLDLVVIAYPKTVPLLKILHESFLMHYRGPGKLYVFSDDECLDEVSALRGARTEVIRKEELLPGHRQLNGYLTQMYFKLIAHRVVKNDHYLVIDDDYLFIRPTFEEDFFPRQKPIWFLQKWELAGYANRWRESSKKLFNIDSPYCFITTPAFVLNRNVLRAMEGQFDLKKIFELQEFAEFQAYGAYAFEFFREHYDWVDSQWGDEIFGCRANQPPPDYLTLDPTMKIGDFPAFGYIQFWSHWSKAEVKMREFLRGSK